MTDEWAKRVCQVGQGAACCRYLLLAAHDGWRCGKLTDFKAYFDRRVTEGTITAQGDNCPGYPTE